MRKREDRTVRRVEEQIEEEEKGKENRENERMEEIEEAGQRQILGNDTGHIGKLTLQGQAEDSPQPGSCQRGKEELLRKCCYGR